MRRDSDPEHCSDRARSSRGSTTPDVRTRLLECAHARRSRAAARIASSGLARHTSGHHAVAHSTSQTRADPSPPGRNLTTRSDFFLKFGEARSVDSHAPGREWPGQANDSPDAGARNSSTRSATEGGHQNIRSGTSRRQPIFHHFKEGMATMKYSSTHRHQHRLPRFGQGPDALLPHPERLLRLPDGRQCLAGVHPAPDQGIRPGTDPRSRSTA